MRTHIWMWFMVFTLIVFILLWVCQIIFLQYFYERMKTRDIIAVADEMLEEIDSPDYQQKFTQLAVDN